MVNLTLPFRVAGTADAASRSAMTTFALPFGPWQQFVQGIRDQHPTVADRVLTSAGAIAPGFALVLNDEVIHGGHSAIDLRPGDEVFIIPTFAGG